MKGNRNWPGGERSRKADVSRVTTLLLMSAFNTETWLSHREHNGTGKYSLERGVETLQTHFKDQRTNFHTDVGILSYNLFIVSSARRWSAAE